MVSYYSPCSAFSSQYPHSCLTVIFCLFPSKYVWAYTSILLIFIRLKDTSPLRSQLKLLIRIDPIWHAADCWLGFILHTITGFIGLVLLTTTGSSATSPRRQNFNIKLILLHLFTLSLVDRLSQLLNRLPVRLFFKITPLKHSVGLTMYRALRYFTRCPSNTAETGYG